LGREDKKVTLVMAEPQVAEESAAGQDPGKRRQIMEGARAVFLEKGFDAASMNDIARVAGVSKGTLYVYFENKERLFLELISTEKREELFSVIQLDHDNRDVAAVLTECGTSLVEILTRPYYVRAMRTVFSIVNRMPEIGAEFYGRGPQLCAEQIALYLESQVKAGVLVIDDCEVAASQFMELAQTGILRKLLFGIVTTPNQAEIRARVESAVAFFMKVYGAPRNA
jgi:AcrR family transcriptional regulator